MKTKQGFSLIEILLVLSVIMISLTAAFFVYEKTSISRQETEISQDISYAYSEYTHGLNIYPISSFNYSSAYKRPDLNPIIHSNFKQFRSGVSEKTFKSKIGNLIMIFPSARSNDYSIPHIFTYSIKGKINENLCVKLAMSNLRRADTIYISGTYFYSDPNVLTTGTPQKKGSLKLISEACSDKKQNGINIFLKV